MAEARVVKARLPVAVLATLVAVPAISLVPGVNANYWLHNLILVVMWSVIGMSWNLLSGYCGQVSFGHAAFFGIGAYTAGLLYTKLGLSAWWGLAATLPVLAVAGLVIGFVCLRLRGPFFALATIAVGVILRVVAENLTGFTGGDLGIMIASAPGSRRPGTTTSSSRLRPGPSGSSSASWPPGSATTSSRSAKTRTPPSRSASTRRCTRRSRSCSAP